MCSSSITCVAHQEHVWLTRDMCGSPLICVEVVLTRDWTCLWEFGCRHVIAGVPEFGFVYVCVCICIFMYMCWCVTVVCLYVWVGVWKGRSRFVFSDVHTYVDKYNCSDNELVYLSVCLSLTLLLFILQQDSHSCLTCVSQGCMKHPRTGLLGCHQQVASETRFTSLRLCQ